MIKPLTKKQQAIFSYIKQTIKKTGFPPTVREIGNQFSITVKGAYDHLKAIEKKGYLRCEAGKSRAIELLIDKEDVYADVRSIPLVGTIAAGIPILAQENIESYIQLPSGFLPEGILFGLKVKGDSMTGAGIYDGDIAIIRQQPNANNGEIVAALIDNEATLKILKKTERKVQLLPANEKYSPLTTDSVTILGVLKALFRTY